MINYILAAILLLIVGGAVAYIVKEKKKGVACIGCPNAGNCAGKGQGDSSCKCHR